MNYITIGFITAVFGNKGEIKVNVTTEFPSDRFIPDKKVKVLLEDGNIIEKEIEDVRWQNKILIVKFKDCDSISSAENLISLQIVIEGNELHELPEDTYYIHQIIGLKVYNLKEEYLGEITDCFQTGGNDIYVVNTGNSEILVPALKDVVKKVDLDQKIIHVDLLEEWN